MALLRVLELMDASGSEPIEELRGRCQKLLLKHHPDKTQDADLELYGHIQTVWKALSSFESWRTLLCAQEALRQRRVNRGLGPPLALP